MEESEVQVDGPEKIIKTKTESGHLELKLNCWFQIG